MQVEFLGHAGILVTCGDTRLVMDAWLSPYGAFDASWFQLPCNHHLMERDWCDVSGAIISHEHLDHLDPHFLQRLPDHVPVYVNDYPSRLFHRKLATMTGRRAKICRIGRPYTLGDIEVRAWVEDSPMNHDSVWVLRGDGQTIVHTVDSRLSQQQLDEILDYVGGRVDLLLLQCSGASWYPLVYDNYDAATKYERGLQKRSHKLDYARSVAEYLMPATTVICAGPPVFLDPALAYANADPSFPNPGESRAWFVEQGFGGRVEAPLPEDRLDLTTGEMTTGPVHEVFAWEATEAYVEDYARRMRPHIEEVYAHADAIVVEDLFETFRAHFEKMLGLSDYFLRRIDMTVCFDIEGPGGGQWLVDFRPGGSVRRREPGDDYQYRYSLHSRWLKRILVEGMPWEDFLLSLRFSAARAPDVYNDHLLGLMKFNDLASLDAIERYENRQSGEKIIVTTETGTRYEIDKFCPHAGASMENAPVENGKITCLLHHYVFDLDTGTCLTGNCTLGTRRLGAVEKPRSKEESTS